MVWTSPRPSSNPSSKQPRRHRPSATPRSPSSEWATSAWPSPKLSSPKTSSTSSPWSTLTPTSSAARCSISSTPPHSYPAPRSALPLDPPLFANPTLLWRVQLAGRPSNGPRLRRLRGLFSVENLDCLLEAEQIVAEGQGVVLVNTDEAGILLVTNFRFFFFLHEGTREIHSSWHYTTGND